MFSTSPTGKFSALIDGGAEISVIKDSCAKQLGFQPFQVPSVILKYGNEAIKSSCWAITIPGFLGIFMITNESSEDIIISHDYLYLTLTLTLNNFILVYNLSCRDGNISNGNRHSNITSNVFIVNV